MPRVGDQDVGGLDVAMHDVGGMSGLQRRRDLLAQADYVIDRQTTGGDALFERAARHDLHHDEVDVAGRIHLVDGDDVRVVEGGGGPRLLDETLPPIAFGRVVTNDLQRDASD